MEIEDLLFQIEAFYQAAVKTEGMQGVPESLPPVQPERIVALAETLGAQIPAEVQRLWLRGLQYSRLHAGTPGSGEFATAYFEWLTVDEVADNTGFLRDVAAQCDGEEQQVLQTGIPLTRSPPQLLVDWRGGVRHYSAENGLEPAVTDSFAEFLEHWLEAGCFDSHGLNTYLPKIEHLVPGRIPPERNLWIQYYRRVFAAYV